MGLSDSQKQEISSLLKDKIRHKLINYSPETQAMPFHFRLLGKDRMALYSFIHSVNTMLGQSIFEHVGRIIAEPKAKRAIDQYKKFEGYISSEAVLKIDNIMRELRSASQQPHKEKETKEVLKVANKGALGKKVKKRVDLFIETKEGVEYYFEIKTAKPNINEFAGIKKQLLDWVAMRGSQDQNVNIKTIVAIPYNPYEPEPYERWTLQGLFDLKSEVLVGKEFWDLLGGDATYEELLSVFEKTGIELRKEIDQRFSEFKNLQTT